MKQVKINQVTKKFLDGYAKDLEYTEKTFAAFELGKIYSDCVTGSKYQIISVEKVDITL